jgi:Transglutaminase-like superfamily
MARRVDIPSVRAAWWTFRSITRARRRLDRAGLDAQLDLPAPPRLPDEAGRGVRAVLRRSDATCLVQAVVTQTWEAAHGRERDLIIGVTSPRRGFEAHAWLEGDPPPPGESFRELLRRPAR